MSLKLISEINPRSFNVKDKDGLTPVHEAANRSLISYKENTVEAFELIAAANPESLATVDNNGLSSAHMAARSSQALQLLKIIEKYAPSSLQTINNVGSGIALSAVRGQNVDSFAMIIRKNPESLKDEDSEGNNVAHLAIEMGMYKFLNLIEKEDPILFAQLLKRKNKSGTTPVEMKSRLHDSNSFERPHLWAAKNNNLVALEATLEVAPHLIEEKDKYGESAVSYAILNNKLEAVSLLAKKSPVSFKSTNHNGDSCAHMAAKTGNAKIFSVVAQANPDSLSAINKKGVTSAIVAASQYNEKQSQEYLAILQHIASNAPLSLKVKRQSFEVSVNNIKKMYEDSPDMVEEIIQLAKTRFEDKETAFDVLQAQVENKSMSPKNLDEIRSIAEEAIKKRTSTSKE